VYYFLEQVKTSDFDFGDKLSFSIINQLPEPSTLADFTLGIMGIVARRFNK
jgi:hypothetical protein